MPKTAATDATDTPRERKNVTFSVTVDKNLHSALEDFRWGERLKMSQIAGVAIREYLENRGVQVAADTSDSQG